MEDEDVKERADKTNEGVKVKNPQVKIKVDGKEEDNEEVCSHAAWSWDQPKRSAVHCVQFHLFDALKLIPMMLFMVFCVREGLQNPRGLQLCSQWP